MTLAAVQESLVELGLLSSSFPLLYCSNDRKQKMLSDADVEPFSQLLSLCREDKISLFLHTDGGHVSAAKKIAALLRSKCKQLDIYVPKKAKSSGTLLCFAADKIVFGGAANLSPIDPALEQRDAFSKNSRGISSENMKAFFQMTKDWLQVSSEEGRIKVLEILLTRFEPDTLGSFYRADQFLRQTGAELLRFGRPHITPEQVTSIVSGFLCRYPSHVSLINVEEARGLGLKVEQADDSLEIKLKALLSSAQQFLNCGSAARVDEDARCALVSSSQAFVFTKLKNEPSADRPGKGKWSTAQRGGI